MELYIYDRNLELRGVFEKIISFIWTRRYNSVGEFKLLVPFTPEYNERLKMYRLIVKWDDDDEAGEIRYIEIRKNSQGKEEIEVQGRFITNWLGKRIILAPIVSTAPPQNIMTRIVTENVTNPTNANRRLHNITHTDISGISRDSIDYNSEPFMNVGLTLERGAKASRLGFNITADIRQKRYFFNIFDGLDLTSGNAAKNPPAVFSVEFDNILEQTFTNSTERLRSTAYVGGEDPHDRPRRIVEVGQAAAGHDRAEVFINATDIVQFWRDENGNEQSLTNQQYDDLLFQRGVQQLEYFAETLAFTSKVNTHANLRYKIDYDLGDRVTCINRRWGVRIDVRITEIMEVYQNHPEPEIEITFGESLPALIEQIRALHIQ